MITQKLDPADSILAFTIEWVRRMAARVEALDVLCLESRIPPDALPANVTVWSMGKDRGVGRAGRLLAFYRALFRLAPKIDAVFCHMIPRFAYLAAAVAMPFNLPLYLWYTHRQDNRELRLATAFCKQVFSAMPESFPFETPKLVAVGHGIDTAFFAPLNVAPASPPLIVQVARLMPIKHQGTLLRAVAALPDLPLSVAIVGSVPAGQDVGYEAKLQEMARALGIADRVQFMGALPAEAVRDLCRRATVAVNLSPPGLFDKAALESMMVGTPTVVANPAFDGLLRDHARLLRVGAPDDVDGLAVSLRTLLTMPADARADIALDVVGRARIAHSLDGLMDRLVEIMAAE